MISLSALKVEFYELFREQFPDAEFSFNERRSTILEIRVFFTPEVFMEFYFNAITGKKSFALVKSGTRIWGYDNYRYWHHHPLEHPETHIPCSQPSLKQIAEEIQTALTKIESM